MSKESLERFVKQEFLRQGSTQDQLKTTDSLDSFVNLMVRLGNDLSYSFTAEEVQAFIQEELERQKTAIQEKADQKKVQMESLPSSRKEQKQATVQAEADKQKQKIDDAIQNHWQKNRIVEIGIANLNGDPILPLY